MVEGFPTSGLQLMTRVGDFFRVARTEVGTRSVARHTHTHTPHHHEQHHHKRVIVRAVLQGPWPCEMGVWGSQTSSPPQLGAHSTPTSVAPPPEGDGPLLCRTEGSPTVR